MAKGSQNGVLKGKRGNTVFFKIANSNNKEKQGSREYVAEVANPMTVPQATQRVKMTPAIRFYSAFKEDCLDHSFEGVKYGGQSMRHFMKKAFELQTGWPFAQKGLAVALPAEYLMSQGSLNPIWYEFDSSNNFVCENLAMIDGTLGAWAQSVIDASHGTIQNGDQITIITLEGDNIMAPWPKTVRVVLDTTATGSAETALSEMGINITPDGVINPSGTGFSIFGGAVILSRPEIAQTTGALTWKRSTQRMAVNFGNRDVASLFTQAAYNAAVRSYTKSGNREIQSGYYLNQGKRNAAGLNIPDAPIPENLPMQIDVTYTAEWIDGSDHDSWGSGDVNLKEGSDGNEFDAFFSSEEELDLSLCNLVHVENGQNITTNKVLQADGSVKLSFYLRAVPSGNHIVANYNGHTLTGKLQINYMVNP